MVVFPHKQQILSAGYTVALRSRKCMNPMQWANALIILLFIICKCCIFRAIWTVLNLCRYHHIGGNQLQLSKFNSKTLLGQQEQGSSEDFLEEQNIMASAQMALGSPRPEMAKCDCIFVCPQKKRYFSTFSFLQFSSLLSKKMRRFSFPLLLE